jgi:hypothetical protein
MEHTIDYRGFEITIDKETEKESYFWLIRLDGINYGSSGTMISLEEAALDAKEFIDNIFDNLEREREDTISRNKEQNSEAYQ